MALEYRRAVFIAGCESSGTRMMTRYFIAAGFDGEGGHSQKFDNLNFMGREPHIVFRRSIPHGGSWPDIEAIYHSLTHGAYKIYPIFTWRDPSFMAISQVKAGHTHSKTSALERITRALREADMHYENLGITPRTIIYEDWISRPELRQDVCKWIGVNEPQFEIFDANKKYSPDMRMSYNKEKMNEVILTIDNMKRLFQYV